MYLYIYKYICTRSRVWKGMQFFTMLMDANKLSNTMRIKEHGPLVDDFVFFIDADMP